MLYLRFVARTGDAMGMNMLGKGVEHTLKEMSQHLPDMTVVSVSGNVCTGNKGPDISRKTLPKFYGHKRSIIRLFNF